jgi:hypothetical protein
LAYAGTDPSTKSAEPTAKRHAIVAFSATGLTAMALPSRNRRWLAAPRRLQKYRNQPVAASPGKDESYVITAER